MGKGKGAPEQWVAVVKSVAFSSNGGVDAGRRGDALPRPVAHHTMFAPGRWGRHHDVDYDCAARVPDLEQRERELAEQLFRLRLQKSMGQQEAADKLRQTRRDLARVKTLLRGYVLGTEAPASA
ncbi:50S ribosomal protein L29 [Geodia barretti]|uniref:60S ribosomal protein L35 n=1 Tax=Geodia barretti TaxID=519541 RepID=A0AA35WBE3_GEOBA|nr:50S ribosomal protein L29 [Geodia barretti]